MANVKVKFVWKGPEVTNVIRQAASRGVLRAANVARNEIIRLILETAKSGKLYGSHQASAPGEAPASNTGALIRSIRVEHEGLKARVLVSAAHAAKLEFGTQSMRARPFVRSALANKQKEIGQVIATEIRKAMK